MVSKSTRRPIVLAAIMIAMFMSAIEATIVSTAMPSIVSDLGGFSSYSWVFSAYLLMNMATTLIYGKLSDLYGRRPIFIIGVVIFLIGSTLCGFATSMETLIAFRFLQGLGAGAVMPIASTIVGDMYTKEERAQIQGYLSSVWGISAVLGPALGGFFVEVLSWHYVFWMNIPLGVLAIIVVGLYLHEEVDNRKREIDYLGSVWLVISLSALMFILVEGGIHIPWSSSRMFTLIGIFSIGMFLFIRQERKATEPMMPFELWKERSITISNLGALTTGAMLIGVSSFLPAFVQGVMERSATVAGFTLTTMSIGWPIAATIAGRLLLKIGYRKTSLFGGIALIIGAIFFVTLSLERGPIWAACGSFFIGIGMGLMNTSFIVSIQSTVSWKLRGIATASNMFMRNLGSALGAALLGGILNSRLHAYIQNSGLGSELSINDTNVLLDAKQRAQMSEQMKSVLQEGLTISLHTVYWGVFLFACISFFLVIFMPISDKQGGETGR
ncbi:MDR family MFS transporter [Bacillus solimangrovi]|uniref:MFS transporter n=1 Tax=Bacillus solimangrovi TaxID=1305675 RepID=A0A1E5LJQ0_9BACI|nr:MDR family MFS transporter [Bacillus solimangrovi]OEH94248.1 MFS transporter [Bacillus solimangrovi]